jgi:hypothetical protein
MSRSIKILSLFALIGLFGLGGCATVDMDRSADFSKYKTFAWLPAEIKVGVNPKYNSDLINRNIKYAVETEFAKRGIAKTTKSDADFLIGYHTYTEKKERTTGGNYGAYPFYPYYGGWGWGWRSFGMMPYYGGWGSQPRTYSFTEGTLIIDVVDNQTKQLVWRGAVDGDVENVARLQKRIQKGVEAIMKKYPARPDQELPANRPANPIVS